MLKLSVHANGRLSGGCVLKQPPEYGLRDWQIPAAFRRLCVETVTYEGDGRRTISSRLQAAVC